MIGRILLLSVCLLAGAAAARPVPSVIEIPLRVDLRTLMDGAEHAVPRQGGDPRGTEWHGVHVAYQAWRGPLQGNLRGETLWVQAHVRYWIQARKSLLGAIDLDGSCGVQEPPRQAIVGVLARLRWSPDWRLHPEFRVLPTRFLDPCEMTALRIDVTPLIQDTVRGEIEDGLREALDGLEPHLEALRTEAGSIWHALQQPLDLGGKNALLLRPLGLALSPVIGRDGYLESRLALAVDPVLVDSAAPAPAPRPLPPLGFHVPRSTDLVLDLAVDLRLEDLNRRLTQNLAARTLDLAGRRVSVEEVTLSGEQDLLRVVVEMSGEIRGRLTLTGQATFDPEDRQLRIEALDYRLDTEDPDLATASDLFHEPVRRALQSAVNGALQRQVQDWKQQVQRAVDGRMPQGARLDLSALTTRDLRFEIATGILRVRGLASGHAEIRATQQAPAP